MSAPQLSPSAHRRLRDELDDLTTRGRIEVAQKIESARLLGDLSENGDYHAAKDEQGHMEGRIRQLEHLMEHAEILEPPAAGEVGVGSVVTIAYDGDRDDQGETYLLGHVEELTSGLDVMSPESPLGSALLGTRQGDTVEYQAPTGIQRVRVLQVEATPA